MKLLTFDSVNSILYFAAIKKVLSYSLITKEIKEYLPPDVENTKVKNKNQHNNKDISDILIRVNNISLSHNNKYLIISYDNKLIVVWCLLKNEIISTTFIKKKPTSILVSLINNQEDKECLIISDKAGDVIAYSLPSLDKNVLLCGHTASVVTDLHHFEVNSGDNKLEYLVTTDRDEKIRISNFPDVETIHTYCLGHTSVVTSSSYVGDNLLVSTSWDHSIKLWDINTGKCIDSYHIEEKEEEKIENDLKKRKLNEEQNNNKQENEEEEDIEKEKEYNENDAGSFPIKILSYNKKLYIILKNFPILLILSINNDNKLIKEDEIILKSLPIDLLLLKNNNNNDNDKLFLLLSKPNLFQIFNINNNNILEENNNFISSVDDLVEKIGKYLYIKISFKSILYFISSLSLSFFSISLSSWYSFLSYLYNFINISLILFLDGTFDQSLISGGFDDEASGMMRHVLDKHFSPEDDINFQAKKGARRSKKKSKNDE